MMLCARMHLRGPWEYELSAGDRTAGKVHLPASWQNLFGEYRGSIRWRRRFHRPSRLDPDERMWLVLHQVRTGGIVQVNGQLLGHLIPQESVQRFDLTPHLQPDNLLQLELEWCDGTAMDAPVGLHQLVALEIHRDD